MRPRMLLGLVESMSLPEKESLALQFARSPSTSLHGDEPPACDPRNECGVELPALRLFLFAPNLSRFHCRSLSSSEQWNSNGSTFFFVRAIRLRMGGASAERAQLWQERGASRHAHALNRPLQQLHAPGAAFQVPCATPSAAENYMSRKTAISPHHPAISTRHRGRDEGDSTHTQNV